MPAPHVWQRTSPPEPCKYAKVIRWALPQQLASPQPGLTVNHQQVSFRPALVTRPMPQLSFEWQAARTRTHQIQWRYCGRMSCTITVWLQRTSQVSLGRNPLSKTLSNAENDSTSSIKAEISHVYLVDSRRGGRNYLDKCAMKPAFCYQLNVCNFRRKTFFSSGYYAGP